MRPHLHARLGRGEIAPDTPHEIIDTWQEAHRRAGIDALVQRRDLIEMATLLESAEIRSLALKGSWLAWHAYPAAAERVLRDIDLLVAPEDGERAIAALLASGLTPLDGDGVAMEGKHYAPLVTPGGTMVELHVHLWEPPGTMEWPTPPLRDEQIIARAVSDPDQPALRYPAPADMLTHLAIHAAYSHRFEVGPLLLADVDYVVANSSLDWAEFWQNAQRGKYARGAALVLALVDHWRRPGLLEQSQCPVDVDSQAINCASGLLVQPLSARRSTRSLAAFSEARAAGGLAKAAATGFGRMGKLLKSPSHLVRRSAQTLGDLGSGDVRASAENSARIGEWLARE